MLIRALPGLRLGIVGHAADKFIPLTEALAKQAITDLIIEQNPSQIISGGCHLGGVDIWAEEISIGLGIHLLVHKPLKQIWFGGYKERNLKIARDSDLVAVIVVKDYSPNYRGMTFNGCYHCGDRNPPHVKSGGCWTAWKARERRWIFI